MTIHHDKMAYGKLIATSEELSEEKIAEMLKKLNSEENDEATRQQHGEKLCKSGNEEKK